MRVFTKTALIAGHLLTSITEDNWIRPPFVSSVWNPGSLSRVGKLYPRPLGHAIVVRSVGGLTCLRTAVDPSRCVERRQTINLDGLLYHTPDRREAGSRSSANVGGVDYLLDSGH
jgi:hypothetical protein